NVTTAGDTLISVASPAAVRVEVHSMEMKNDTMVMRPVENGLAIPAKDTVLLAPGGYHLMFLDINDDFKVDEKVHLTLTFAEAGTIELDMPIRMPTRQSTDHKGHAGADHSNHK